MDLYDGNLPKNLKLLSELALDLRWTWSHESDQLWKAIAPEFWVRQQNPWLILQNVSQADVQKVLRDRVLLGELEYLLEARKDYLQGTGWFRQNYPENSLKPVVYFSMEFGLGEGLPLYAGGLGILAGDYLKTASDLNVPMVGVGILYQEGYFRQILDNSGWQIEAFPYNDPTSLPIRPVLDSGGGRLRVSLELPGRRLWIRVWQAQVGRVVLYLLDSNDPLNSPADRGITNKLYDGRPEIRLMQQMILGVAGWRVVKKLGIESEICHLNEGHAAFVVMERACEAMGELKEFPLAVCATRAGNVFTTHTPVAAGFDSFAPALIAHYFRDYLEEGNIPLEQMLALGRKDPANSAEPFNMAYLAMHGSNNVNAVSRLHGKVSRRLFQPLFPQWPTEEVPVNHVTNGIHVPSWDSEFADDVWTRAYGKERWLHTVEKLEGEIQALSDKDLWVFRTAELQRLIDFVRQRLSVQLGRHGADTERTREISLLLDTETLAMGFARRFTAYKRPNLLLTDPDRLEAIITNTERPVQLIVAGKAHPDDEEGKRLVQEFVRFAEKPAVRRRVVFVEDYDIAVAQLMVQGVDLWLNTPRRPWEACGTSGMKTLVNGGLNCSELDGWWAEAYDPEFGWCLGDGQEHEEPDWDAREANQLYDLLEKEIVPEFYRRNELGIPLGWVKRMRASMALLTPRFSSNRMLREYLDGFYLPATNNLRQRVADGYRLANEIYAWQNLLDRCWPTLRFGKLDLKHEGSVWQFEVEVFLGELDPEVVNVELYAEPLDGGEAVRIWMLRGQKIPEANGYVYRAEAPAARPAAHYTPRIIPAHRAASIPLEDAHILWMR